MKRINILHIITELEVGGAENLLLNICRKMDKKNFNILVGYIYGPCTLANQFRRTGVRLVDLSRRSKIDPLLLFKLFFLIRKERIQIVHTHLVHASIAGRIAAKLAGMKSIVTTRHYGYYHKEKSLINWIERKTAVFNSNFIAISKAVKEYMNNREKYKPEKITVIYNAVDLSLFDSEAPVIISRNNDDFLIGSVGRLHPSKGYDTLLKSMPQVIKEFPSAKLIIIGDGIQRKYLEGVCYDLGISEQVIFLGRKTSREVIDFLKKIDIFVLASNWEGFGLALLEAMACAKPVVATNVGGIREIVDAGETGFLVPPRHPQKLAENIIRLCKDSKLSETMGKRGRQKVEKLFSIHNMISRLTTLYQKSLASRETSLAWNSGKKLIFDHFLEKRGFEDGRSQL
jgi:glycosyltransferase involved in cell wall biosynthesis